jgi:hypothetical protein
MDGFSISMDSPHSVLDVKSQWGLISQSEPENQSKNAWRRQFIFSTCPGKGMPLHFSDDEPVMKEAATQKSKEFPCLPEGCRKPCRKLSTGRANAGCSGRGVRRL